MLKLLLRRILPFVLLGSLLLSFCVVYEYDRGPRGSCGLRGYHDWVLGRGY